MVRIAPVKLAYNSRTLWFDARDIDMAEGDHVVVLTARGLEYGTVVAAVFNAEDDEVKKLKSPLKPVKRVATEEDDAQAAELAERGRAALPVFREYAAETAEEMHPVAVEFLFGGDKAVFYFEAENRVDFRELVHKLAAEFHVRVDMRQIGVRDEARMIGGIGHCGQELCCARFGGDFNPVSIRMAKEQDLSLNPQKISGICGRLMCCLRYEYEAYKDFKSRAPKANSTVQTPEGPAKVVSLDVPREVITVRGEGGRDVKVPFAEMDPPEGDAARRTVIGEDAWERALASDGLPRESEARFSTSQFTRDDKLGEAKAVRHGKGKSAKADEAESDSTGRKRRRRRHSTKVETEGHASHADSKRAEGEPSSKPAAGAGSGQASGKGKNDGGKKKGMQPRRRNRGAKAGKPKEGAGSSEQRGENSSRKPRKRGGLGSGEAAMERKASGSPRPGQKSSGLRQGKSKQNANADHAHGEGARAHGEQKSGGSGQHRTARRRSHKASGHGPAGESGRGLGNNAKGGSDHEA